MTRARIVADLISTVDAKGDLLVGISNDTLDNLTVGLNGQFLRVNSATPSGLDWAAVDVAAIEDNYILTIMGAAV
jgi:hypothetical protein